MTLRRIIVADVPDQRFALRTDGGRITLRLRLNPSIDRWAFDLSRDDEEVLFGRRIVTGVDLLAVFGLGVGSLFAHEATPEDVPNRDGLVSGRVQLFHAQ